MSLFPKTRRTDMDLELTRDRFDTKQFDKETLDRMEKQQSNYDKAEKIKEDLQKVSISSSVVILGIIVYLVLKK